jgi:hypothetical protein
VVCVCVRERETECVCELVWHFQESYLYLHRKVNFLFVLRGGLKGTSLKLV